MKFYKFLPVMILLLSFAACRLSQNVPPELSGTWRTEDEKYKDKFMQFDESYVTVSINEEIVPKVELIKHIETHKEGPRTTYIIEAEDQQGNKDKMTVLYSPQNGGELRLSNPRVVVWKRVS